jgi:hypothetical protein
MPVHEKRTDEYRGQRRGQVYKRPHSWPDSIHHFKLDIPAYLCLDRAAKRMSNDELTVRGVSPSGGEACPASACLLIPEARPLSRPAGAPSQRRPERDTGRHRKHELQAQKVVSTSIRCRFPEAGIDHPSGSLRLLHMSSVVSGNHIQPGRQAEANPSREGIPKPDTCEIQVSVPRDELSRPILHRHELRKCLCQRLHNGPHHRR